MNNDAISGARPSPEAPQPQFDVPRQRIGRSDSPVLHPQSSLELRVDTSALSSTQFRDTGTQTVSIRLLTDSAQEATSRPIETAIDWGEMLALIPHKIVLPQKDGRVISLHTFLAPSPLFDSTNVLLGAYLKRRTDRSPAAAEFASRVSLFNQKESLCAAQKALGRSNGRGMIQIAGFDGWLNSARVRREATAVNTQLQAEFKSSVARDHFARFRQISDLHKDIFERARKHEKEMVLAVGDDGVSYQNTSRQMETRPARIQDSISQLIELMQSVTQLPANEHTRELATELVILSFELQKSLCDLIITTDGYQFNQLAFEKLNLLQKAAESGDQIQIETARKVLQAVVNKKLPTGVHQTWMTFNFFYAQIDLLERSRLTAMPSDFQEKVFHQHIENFIGAIEALHHLTVTYSAVISAAASSDFRFNTALHDSQTVQSMVNEAAPDASLLKSSTQDPGNHSDADTGSRSAPLAPTSESTAVARHVLSEISSIGVHGRNLFTTLMSKLWNDKAHFRRSPNAVATEQGQRSREEMKAWARSFQETSRAYADVQALVKSIDAHKSVLGASTTGVEEVVEVLQRWEQVYHLAGDLLQRYSTQFCKSQVIQDEASQWLSGHMKMLASMRTARVITRTQKSSHVKIVTSAELTDTIEQIDVKPRLSLQEIDEALRKAGSLIAEADQSYGSPSTPAPFFKHHVLHNRLMEVREMRTKYYRALQQLDLLAKDSYVLDNPELIRSVNANIEKCWERRVVLQVVLKSPQIEIPLEAILKPRWQDGRVQAIRPERGDVIVNWDWTDPKTGRKEPRQLIRIQLNDEPIVVRLDSGRSLPAFAVDSVFAHLHLKTTKETKIESLNQVTTPNMIVRVRLKIAEFDNVFNDAIRDDLGFRHVPATDASSEWGFDLLQQVVRQDALADAEPPAVATSP